MNVKEQGGKRKEERKNLNPTKKEKIETGKRRMIFSAKETKSRRLWR